MKGLYIERLSCIWLTGLPVENVFHQDLSSGGLKSVRLFYSKSKCTRRVTCCSEICTEPLCRRLNLQTEHWTQQSMAYWAWCWSVSLCSNFHGNKIEVSHLLYLQDFFHHVLQTPANKVMHRAKPFEEMLLTDSSQSGDNNEMVPQLRMCHVHTQWV